MFLVSILIIFTFWLIVNFILKIELSKYLELNDLTKSILKNRKILMFNILVLIILFLFKSNILNWIIFIYYIILAIISFIILIISIITRNTCYV